MKVRPWLLLPLLLPLVAEAAPRAVVAQQVTAASPFHAEFTANLDEVEDKIIRLAEATPAEKFSWRPSKDVRSIAEIYTHIAAGNYFLCTFLDVNAPKASTDIEERVTKKADVIAELKKSFAHLRATAANARDLEKRVKMFGSQKTTRAVLLTTLTHLHEHLGQAIAYARMNGVTPPWSR